MAVVAAKTPAVAVLLSILWLGAGHLYAGRTALGLALMAVDVFLVLFLMVPLIGWVLAPLAWFGLCIYAAISSSNAVKRRNAQWGLPQY
jgi:TM2 domain-containing membrane protein YozV